MRNFWRNSFVGSCLAFRRALLDSALPFPPTIPMHDQWLGLIAQRTGTVRLLDQALILYRRHQATATASDGRHAGVLRMLAWRLALIRALRTRIW
jgi:hypothetical protein